MSLEKTLLVLEESAEAFSQRLHDTEYLFLSGTYSKSGLPGGCPDGAEKISGTQSSTQQSTSELLTMRDFPGSGFQLHIHEGETRHGEYGSKAHLKTYDGEKFRLNSYEAAMADLTADQLGIIQRLKQGKVTWKKE